MLQTLIALVLLMVRSYRVASVIVYSDPVNGNATLGTTGYGYKQVSTMYTATSTQTVISILTRHDPAYFYYDDVYFALGQANLTVPANNSNLLQNPGFETGGLSPWVLVGQQGLSAGAAIRNDLPHSGTYELKDGAVGGIDGISQVVRTVPGQVYSFSFWVAADRGSPALSQVTLVPLDPPVNLRLVTDSGDSASDRITNARPMTISGTAPAGQAVSLYVNGTRVATGSAVLGDTFSINIVTTNYPYGLESITATTTAGGFESLMSSVLEVTYVPPGTYAITGSVVARSINTVTVAGSTSPEPSRTVQYRAVDNANQVVGTGTVISDSNGAFTFAFNSLLGGTVTVSSSDIAGNPLSQSITYGNILITPSSTILSSSSIVSTVVSSSMSISSSLQTKDMSSSVLLSSTSDEASSAVSLSSSSQVFSSTSNAGQTTTIVVSTRSSSIVDISTIMVISSTSVTVDIVTSSAGPITSGAASGFSSIAATLTSSSTASTPVSTFNASTTSSSSLIIIGSPSAVRILTSPGSNGAGVRGTDTGSMPTTSTTRTTMSSSSVRYYGNSTMSQLGDATRATSPDATSSGSANVGAGNSATSLSIVSTSLNAQANTRTSTITGFNTIVNNIEFSSASRGAGVGLIFTETSRSLVNPGVVMSGNTQQPVATVTGITNSPNGAGVRPVATGTSISLISPAQNVNTQPASAVVTTTAIIINDPVGQTSASAAPQSSMNVGTIVTDSGLGASTQLPKSSIASRITFCQSTLLAIVLCVGLGLFI